MSPWRTLFVLIPLLALAGTVPVLADGDGPDPPASPASSESTQAPPVGHREVLDDPPAPVKEESQPRTTETTVIVGNHVSVQVNVDAQGNNIVGDAANEPSMAISPANPNVVVIGWRQFDTIVSNFRQAGWAYSHDAGNSWTFPGSIQAGTFRSDPVLSADQNGVIYYYSLSTLTSVEMFRSVDNGVTWIGGVFGFGGDKQWMGVDTSGLSGNIHAIWNSQFSCCAAGTDETRSIDGGLSFEGPWSMPIKTKWGTVDIGRDGELYVTGSDLDTGNNPAHYIMRADNAFNTSEVPSFDLAQGIDLGGSTVAGGTPNPQGLLGQVWVAVDRSTGPTRGYVYVLGAVDPPGADPVDIHLIRSEDQGQTWTAPVRINDDPPTSNAWQWFGALSVAPDGRLDVTWYDTRNDGSGVNSEVYYSYSTDQGDTWSANLLVAPSFNSLVGQPNQAKIGDYTHQISNATGAALAYAATYNGEQDVYFLRVGDCDANGQHDSADIAADPAADCDANGILDSCEDQAEICDDGIDNDCDLDVDCDDSDCLGFDPEICDDGIDNDCDQTVDCDDLDCLGAIPEICQDGVDNDCDGAIDCFDTDCLGLPTCPCDMDGVCEDGENCLICPGDCPGDGVAFCCGDDICDVAENPCICEPDCGAFTATELVCADGIDNDCDGAIDCSDIPDCSTNPPPTPPGGSPDLEVRPNSGTPLLVWTSVPDAISYDVVEGSLTTLVASGGDYSVATSSCVIAGTRFAQALSPAPPAGGEVLWLLVRPRNCGGAGSFDSGGPAQASPRDVGIAASGNSCPSSAEATEG